MRLRFTDQQVQTVPSEAGVFCLWYGRDLVHVGCTAPRSDLRSYFADWGRLPKYNEPAGQAARGEGALLRAG